MERKNAACLFLFVICLLSGGCSAYKLPLHDIARHQLQVWGVEDCSITKLGDFSGVGYSAEDVIVGREEVEEAVQAELESYEKLIAVTDRNIVEKGDFVTISYKVFCAGKLVNTVNSETLKVGAGKFDGKLEEALAGAKKGKTFTVEITVPRDSENKEYAGKKEIFKITVNEIQFMHTEKLTDSFVKENYNLDTVEAFYGYEENLIRKEKESETLLNVQNLISEKARGCCSFQLDEDEVLNHALKVYQEYMAMASGYGGSMEEFLADFTGETPEDFYEGCYKEAESDIKWALVVGAVAEKNGIQVTNKELMENAKDSAIDIASLSEEALAAYKYQILEQKVLSYMMTNLGGTKSED